MTARRGLRLPPVVLTNGSRIVFKRNTLEIDEAFEVNLKVVDAHEVVVSDCSFWRMRRES